MENYFYSDVTKLFFIIVEFGAGKTQPKKL